MQDLTELDHEDMAAYQTWLYFSGNRKDPDKPLSLRTQSARLSAVQGFFRHLFKARDPASTTRRHHWRSPRSTKAPSRQHPHGEADPSAPEGPRRGDAAGAS